MATESSGRQDLVSPPYPMRLYWEKEDEGWVAEVIDLPGCIGVGESPQQAVEVARRFIQTWIDDAVEAGENVPAPSERPAASGRYLARWPRSLHERLQRTAEDEGVSLNQLLVMLVSEGLVARGASSQMQLAAERLEHASEAVSSWTAEYRGWTVALAQWWSSAAGQRDPAAQPLSKASTLFWDFAEPDWRTRDAC